MTSPMFTPVVTATSGLPIVSTGAFALIVVITFVVLVIQKEVDGFGAQRGQPDLGRGLNIGIIPFGIGSCVIAVVRLLHMYA